MKRKEVIMMAVIAIIMLTTYFIAGSVTTIIIGAMAAAVVVVNITYEIKIGFEKGKYFFDNSIVVLCRKNSPLFLDPCAPGYILDGLIIVVCSSLLIISAVKTAWSDASSIKLNMWLAGRSYIIAVILIVVRQLVAILFPKLKINKTVFWEKNNLSKGNN